VRPLVDAYNWWLALLPKVARLILTLALISILTDVTLRDVGLGPPAWTLPLVEYALLYMTMMMAPWLVRQKGHIVVEAFTSMMPKAFFRWWAKFVYLACVVICLLFAWYALSLMIDAYQTNDIDIRSIEIPRIYLFLPMVVGFVMMAIEFARYLLGFDTLYSGRIGETGAA
jgi:C4-dicarboxylate transporter, DctQ subunit